MSAYVYKKFKLCMCGKTEIPVRSKYCDQCRPDFRSNGYKKTAYLHRPRPGITKAKSYKEYLADDKKHKITLKEHLKLR